MDLLTAFLTAALVPGGLEFLFIGVAIGTALLFRAGRCQHWARRWLVFLIGSYWFLSVPVGGALLTRGLTLGMHPWSPESGVVNAIVVLDGGTVRYRAGGREVAVVSRTSALRALEAARVYRSVDTRPWVVVTAGGYDLPPNMIREGEALKEALIRAGVPPHRIVLDSDSNDTHESAVHVATWLLGRHVTGTVVVTSAPHIRRAVQAFRAQGVDPVPAPAANPVAPTTFRAQYLPSVTALHVSEQAIHDYVGLVYYWARGWMNPSVVPSDGVG